MVFASSDVSVHSPNTTIEIATDPTASQTLTTGFPPAIAVSAELITTNAEGIIAGTVSIPVKDGTIPAYRAQPIGSGSFPVVLVVQEIFGVHAHIQDITRRFAKLGYVAIAPELFIRQGDVSKLDKIEDIRAISGKVPDAQVLADLDATVDWAVKSSQGDPTRIGITGFCWGGRITWLYAAHNPNVKAGVAWYGRLVGEASDRTPKHPVDVASTLKVPILGLYGGQDTGIPLATVEQLRDLLKSSSSGSEVIVYPDAPHAFFADYRPSYRATEAKDGWQRLQDWFKQHGL